MEKICLEEFPTSLSARRMLSSVSEGFYDRSYVGKWLFQVMGLEYDTALEAAEGLPEQFFPETATWGLKYHEIKWQLPVREDLPYKERRKIICRKRDFRAPMTPAGMEAYLEDLYGFQVHVADIHDPGPYWYVPPHPNVFRVFFSGAGVLDAEGACRTVGWLKQSHTTAEVTADLGTAGHPLRHGCACLAEGEVSIGWDAPVHRQVLRHGGVCMAEASADIGYEPSMYVFEVRDGHLLMSTDGPAGGPAGFRIDGRGHLMADTDIVPDAGMYRIREDGHLVYDTQG